MKNENDQNDNVNKNVGTSEPKSGASTSAKMARDTNEGFTGNGVTSLQSPDGGNEDLGAKAKDAADSIVTQAKATAGDAEGSTHLHGAVQAGGLTECSRG